jgi:NADPH-dependent ferric siderophore reductase
VHWEPREDAEWTLLAADETGLPALLAIAEQLPAGRRAIAVAEVAGAEEHQPVETRADLEIHWVGRGALAQRVIELDLPDGAGEAWGGGESLAMRDARRHLRSAAPGLEGAVRLLGYWQR